MVIGVNKMKKVLLGLSLATLMLAACGDDTEKEQATAKKEQGVEIDKGLIDVEITLPASFFEGQTEEEIKAEATADGVKDVKVNEDGSVYYKMSKSTHKKMMKEMESGILESIDELVNSEDYTAFKAISYNKDFTEFDVKVDLEAYENSFDVFGIFTLVFSGTFYNAFDGKSTDDLKITINIIDEATNELINTSVFPDDYEDLGESAE